MKEPEASSQDPVAPFRALLASGQLPLAREALRRRLAEPAHPVTAAEAATAYALLARSEERAGDLARARASLERALTLVDWADLRLTLGTLLARLGDKAGARRELDRALAINPNYRAAAVERALLDASEGRIAESLAALRTLGDTPSAATAMPPIEDALARLRSAGVDEAAPWLRRALVPGDEALERMLADAEERILGGDLGGGLALLRRCAAERPGYADVVALLGSYELRAGFVDDGIASLVSALELNPDYHAARLQLARALDLRGERERALAEVRAVLEREPSHPDATALLDWLGGRRRPASGIGPRPDLRRPEGS
jgi:tetratricopeptide (TPR) repeat protein